MFTRLQTKTAEIQTVSLTQDAIGQTEEAWVKTASHICRYEQNAKARVIDGAYKVTLEDYIFFFDKGVVVTNEQRIVIDNRIFDVIASFDIEGMIAPHVEVYARFNGFVEQNTPVATYVPPPPPVVVPPIVVTNSPTNVATSTINAPAVITDFGDYDIDEIGIVWQAGGTVAKPDEDTLPADSGYSQVLSISGIINPNNPYTFGMSGLSPSTSYVYRAWARSGAKYFYSDTEIQQTTSAAQDGGGGGGAI